MVLSFQDRNFHLVKISIKIQVSSSFLGFSIDSKRIIALDSDQIFSEFRRIVSGVDILSTLGAAPLMKSYTGNLGANTRPLDSRFLFLKFISLCFDNLTNISIVLFKCTLTQVFTILCQIILMHLLFAHLDLGHILILINYKVFSITIVSIGSICLG